MKSSSNLRLVSLAKYPTGRAAMSEWLRHIESEMTHRDHCQTGGQEVIIHNVKGYGRKRLRSAGLTQHASMTSEKVPAQTPSL
jgi:hypothetical protein